MNNIEQYLSTKLNNEQLKAALHTNSSSLILAGAGSGKTRVLTYKVAYLLYGKNIHISRILAMTFTNKAANEMKERLVSLADEFSMLENNPLTRGSETKSEGGYNDDPTNPPNPPYQGGIGTTPLSQSSYKLHDFKRIGTFHSIFLKLLREDIDKIKTFGSKKTTKSIQSNNLSTLPFSGGNNNSEKPKGNGLNGYNKSFGILDTGDSQAMIRNILKRLNLQDIFKVNEVKGFISKQKNNGLDPKAFERLLSSNYEESMYKVYKEYQKELEKSNSLDFDDLLLLPYMLFKQNPKILQKWQNHFDYIMVDEAQDTNWIQFELIKMMSGEHGNITLIGDDYQSIYGRRGALMDNFLNVKQYRPDMQMFKLQINYRSRPHIIDAGNSVIKNNQKQYKKDVKAHRKEEGKITCFAHNSDMDEAANLIQLLSKMKGDKFDTWSDIAILYRTNAQSSPFEQILIQEGIPYKIRGAYKFFDRVEIKDVMAYIKFILNPQDSVSLKRIINIPGRKIGKTSIERIEDYALKNNYVMSEVMQNIDKLDVGISTQAKNGIIEFRNIIADIKNTIAEMSPVDIIEKLVRSIKYKDYLLKEEGIPEKAEEKFENIGQLINMANKYDRDSLSGTREDGLATDGLSLLAAFMEEVILLSDTMDNANGDMESIKLMTVHSSKGLEFPFVFVVGLEDNVFPLSNAMMETHLLEEERRLMYVAITRAKEHLFLSYANSRMTRGQTRMNPPSRFIDEIPEHLLKMYDFGNYGNFDKQPQSDIDEGDNVKHKLFGTGYVLEIRNGMAIVRFHNPKFGTRKMECKFLEVV